MGVSGVRACMLQDGPAVASYPPSFCSFSTLASLRPLMRASSFLGAWARASMVWMPPSSSFLMSAAGMPWA